MKKYMVINGSKNKVKNNEFKLEIAIQKINLEQVQWVLDNTEEKITFGTILSSVANLKDEKTNEALQNAAAITKLLIQRVKWKGMVEGSQLQQSTKKITKEEKKKNKKAEKKKQKKELQQNQGVGTTQIIFNSKELDINETFSTGMNATLLMFVYMAINNTNEEHIKPIIELMLNLGADLGAMQCHTRSIVHFIVEANRTSLLKWILNVIKNKNNKNIEKKETLPQQNNELIRIANVNDKYGNPPLYNASSKEMVALLLANGAQLDLPCNWSNLTGVLFLQYFMAYPKTTNINTGKNLTVDPINKKTQHTLLVEILYENYQDRCIAALNQQFAIKSIIIKNNNDTNNNCKNKAIVTNTNSTTTTNISIPAHKIKFRRFGIYNKATYKFSLLAIIAASYIKEYPNLIEQFLDIGVKPDPMVLLNLAYFGHLDVFKKLIDKYDCYKGWIDYQTKDYFNFTPLMEASSSGNIDVVKFLLTQNIDINKTTIYDNTAMALAYASGQKKVVEILLTYMANKAYPNDKQKAENLYRDVYETLYGVDAVVNYKNINQQNLAPSNTKIQITNITPKTISVEDKNKQQQTLLNLNIDKQSNEIKSNETIKPDQLEIITTTYITSQQRCSGYKFLLQHGFVKEDIKKLREKNKYDTYIKKTPSNEPITQKITWKILGGLDSTSEHIIPIENSKYHFVMWSPTIVDTYPDFAFVLVSSSNAYNKICNQCGEPGFKKLRGEGIPITVFFNEKLLSITECNYEFKIVGRKERILTLVIPGDDNRHQLFIPCLFLPAGLHEKSVINSLHNQQNTRTIYLSFSEKSGLTIQNGLLSEENKKESDSIQEKEEKKSEPQVSSEGKNATMTDNEKNKNNNVNNNVNLNNQTAVQEIFQSPTMNPILFYSQQNNLPLNTQEKSADQTNTITILTNTNNYK